MSISNAGLEAMGFRKMADDDFVDANFHKLHVFEVRGLVIGRDVGDQVSGEISRVPYQVAFGDSVNAICQRLIGDKYTEDEGQWIGEKKASPPFAVIHIGPTASYQSRAAFWQIEEDGSITTVDSFPGHREEIAKQDATVLPPLLAALECSFSANRHPVRFVQIDEARYGLTKEGKTVRTIRFLVNATAYASTGIAPEEFAATLKRAVSTASTLNPRVAKFMHLGFQEKDQLKKFLNFFLSIEIETNAVYKKIDHAKYLSEFVTAPSAAVHKTATAFFNDQHSKNTSLKERFIWCVLCVWKHMGDDDVDLFSRLKKTRDDVAHGNISEVPIGATQDAENLVIRLRNTPQ